jgi:hypothetical protein
MQGRAVEIEREIYLYGVSLLMLASKYDELDDKIPYIRDFRNVSSRANFTWDQVVNCETHIVKSLNWDLMALTPENFSTTLLTFGLVFSDEGTPSDLKFLKSIRMYVEMFTDLALQSMEMQQYKYSVQAVASVVAARKAKGIKTEWSPRLMEITGMNWDQIQEAYLTLYSRYEKIMVRKGKKRKQQQEQAKEVNKKVKQAMNGAKAPGTSRQAEMKKLQKLKKPGSVAER